VIDGVLCSEQQKQTKGATKLKQLKLTSGSSMVGAQFPTPVVGGVPEYKLGYP